MTIFMIALVTLFIGLIIAVYFTGRWILGPIDRAAKGGHAPPRVSIGDFLCLFVAVQLPFAAATRIRSEETEGFFWFLTVVAWVVAPIVWMFCARTLSRAGVSGGLHRFLFLGLVLPVVYYGLLPFLLGAAIAAVRVLFDNGFDLAAHRAWLVAWIGTGIALAAAGIYTRRLGRMLGVKRAAALARGALSSDASSSPFDEPQAI